MHTLLRSTCVGPCPPAMELQWHVVFSYHGVVVSLVFLDVSLLQCAHDSVLLEVVCALDEQNGRYVTF